MRTILFALPAILTLVACSKNEDPVNEPKPDFPEAQVIPGKFAYVDNGEIFVLTESRHEAITNTCDLNCFKRNPRWIDDGQKISYVQDFHSVFRVWSDGRYNTNLLASQPKLWTGGAYSPDETLFAATDQLYVYLYSVNENFDVTLIDTVGHSNSSLGTKVIWSPDGTKILLFGFGTTTTHSSLHIFDIVTGEQISLGANTDDSPSWNSQSTRFAYSKDNVLYTADANGENIQQVNDTDEFSVKSPQWSPNGDQLLCGGSDLILYNLATGSATRLMDDEKLYIVENVMWSADGQQIAFNMYYEEYEGLYVYQFADQKVGKLSNKIIGPFDWYSE